MLRHPLPLPGTGPSVTSGVGYTGVPVEINMNSPGFKTLYLERMNSKLQYKPDFKSMATVPDQQNDW